jgi:hypothetical protein
MEYDGVCFVVDVKIRSWKFGVKTGGNPKERFQVPSGRKKVQGLERLKKYCSHSVRKNKAAVFLGFGFVSAQLQGFSTCAFAKASPKHQKSSPRMATVFFKPL